MISHDGFRETIGDYRERETRGLVMMGSGRL